MAEAVQKQKPKVVILGDTPTENADIPQCLASHLR